MKDFRSLWSRHPWGSVTLLHGDFPTKGISFFPEENSDQSGDVMSMCQVSMYPRCQRSRKKAERHALSVDTEA